MFATDDDNHGIDEVHVDFCSLGIWRLDEPNWTRLSGTGNPNDDHTSAQFTSTAGAEDLVMDFGALGIWLYKQDGSGWVQVSTMDPYRVKEAKFYGGLDYEYELLVGSNAGGLYWGDWNGGGMNWTLITNDTIGPGWCETLDIDGTDNGDEEVMIPLNSGGCLLYDFSDSQTLSTFFGGSWYIKFMVKGDYYGRGYDSTMAFVFNSSSLNPGLWLWDDTVGWTKISSSIPDGAY